MHFGQMLEVWVGENLFMFQQEGVQGCECGFNVSFKDLEFFLDNAIGEFFEVLIDELAPEITENLVVESKTIRFDFVRAELGSNGLDLVCDNVHQRLPLVLVTSISHDNFHESVLASHFRRKTAHFAINSTLVQMALEKSLETKAESSEVRSDHTGLIRHWLFSVCITAWSWVTAEDVMLSDFDLPKIVLLSTLNHILPSGEAGSCYVAHHLSFINYNLKL